MAIGRETDGKPAYNPNRREYKVCWGVWDAEEHRYTGCGQYYTLDSVVHKCSCGLDEPLRFKVLDEPPEGLKHIHMEKCLKCPYAVKAVFTAKCFCNIKPCDTCGGCWCRECCKEAGQFANFIQHKIKHKGLTEVVRMMGDKRFKERKG